MAVTHIDPSIAVIYFDTFFIDLNVIYRVGFDKVSAKI